jgi:hypothetical protein
VNWHYRIVSSRRLSSGQSTCERDACPRPCAVQRKLLPDPDGAVRAELHFDTQKRRFTPEEHRKLRAEVASLMERESVLIKFELRAHALFTQGEAKQSFQAYRDLVAQHSKDPIQHLRRARALIDAGMGDAARSEVATAIKLDPKLALAYETQGQPSSNTTSSAGGASTARTLPVPLPPYQKAISLNHDDHSLVADYAILLELDRHGIRYGRGADLAGAIAAYRKLTDEQRQKVGVASNLAFALFYDGQYGAALEAANALESPPLGLLIACDAQLNGVAHALAEAQRRGSSNNPFKQIAALAGTMLMARREYSNAAALLEAGANGANTAQTMALSSMLRQAKRHEDLPAEPGPVGFLRGTYTSVISGSASSDDLDALGSRNYRRERALLSAEKRREIDDIEVMKIVLRRMGTSLDVLADIVQQSVQIKAVGDDTTGYRLSIQMPPAPSQTAFVVKEDGNYRLLAYANWVVPVATEAVERAQRGDLATASTLLAWIRESLTNRQDADDPYAVMPFTRFWSPGQREGDEKAIRLAAASLCGNGIRRRPTRR